MLIVLLFTLLTLLNNASITQGVRSGRRIVGGEPAYDVKFVAQFFMRKKGGKNLCGGSIITQRAILTAAHCFDDVVYEVDDTEIWVGGTRIGQGIQVYPLYVVKHPNYERAAMKFDIALVFLNRALTLFDSVQTIKVANRMVDWNKYVYTAGFGAVQQMAAPMQGAPRTTVSGDLNKVRLFLLTPAACVFLMKGVVTEDQLTTCVCARERDKGTCGGDSGGPLYSENSELIGVVSYGNGCADNRFPAIFTNVPMFKHWINQNARVGKHRHKFRTTYA